MEDLVSINEEGLDKLALNIYDYTERINFIFNRINDLMIQSRDCFECELGYSIVNRFQDIMDSMKNVKLNISSYSDELMMVKKNFRNKAEIISGDVKKHSVDIQSYYN